MGVWGGLGGVGGCVVGGRVVWAEMVAGVVWWWWEVRWCRCGCAGVMLL